MPGGPEPALLIAVKPEPDLRGGSAALHTAEPGDTLEIGARRRICCASPVSPRRRTCTALILERCGPGRQSRCAKRWRLHGRRRCCAWPRGRQTSPNRTRGVHVRRASGWGRSGWPTNKQWPRSALRKQTSRQASWCSTGTRSPSSLPSSLRRRSLRIGSRNGVRLLRRGESASHPVARCPWSSAIIALTRRYLID